MTDPVLVELGVLLRRRDPVPDDVRAAAEAAFALASLPSGWTWLEPIAEEPALVRSGSRSLLFGDDEVAVRVEVRRLPWCVRIVGQVRPVVDVELAWPAGARRVRPDASGFFLADDLPRGRLRVVVGSRVTRWFPA